MRTGYAYASTPYAIVTPRLRTGYAYASTPHANVTPRLRTGYAHASTPYANVTPRLRIERLLWKIVGLASIKVAVIIRLMPCAELRCYRALT